MSYKKGAKNLHFKKFSWFFILKTNRYHTEEEQKRLFGMYQLLHHRVHSAARPLKMVYMVMDTETLVGWVSIILCFSFDVCKADCVDKHAVTVNWWAKKQ